MSKGRYSEDFLNEKEALESLFNFEGEERKAKWQKRKNLMICTIEISLDKEFDEDPDNDSFSEDIRVILSMKIPKDYPKKSPYEIQLKKVHNLEEEDQKLLLKKLHQTVRSFKKEVVCLELVDATRMFIQEIKDRLDHVQSPVSEFSEVDLVAIAMREKEKRKKAYLKKKRKEMKSEEIPKVKDSPSHIFYISDPTKVKKKKKIIEDDLPGNKLMQNVNLELRVRKSTKMKVKKMDLRSWKIEGLKPNGISFHHKTHKAKGIFGKENQRIEMSYVLRRVNYSLTRVGHSLFMIGGEDGKRKYDDMIRFDFRSHSISVFRGLYKASTRQPFNLPYMTNHLAFSHKSQIVVMYPDTNLRAMGLYIISNVLGRPFIGVNLEIKSHLTHKTYELGEAELSPKRLIPMLREYGTCWIRSSLYIFGGSLNATNTMLSNRLFKVLFVGDRRTGPYFEAEEILPIRNEKDFSEINYVPIARRGCGISHLHYNLYLFGGIDEEDNFLNDLHVFNFSSMTWSEIDLGLKPPPLAFFSIYNTGAAFTIFGGRGKKGMISKQMYSYDTRQSKFYVMNPLNRESEEILGRYGMSTCRVTSDSIDSFPASGRMFVGGRTPDRGVLADFSFIEYSNDLGKKLEVLTYLEDCRTKKLFVDTHFIMQVTSRQRRIDEEEEEKKLQQQKKEEEEEIEGEEVIKKQEEEEEEEEEGEMKMVEEYAHMCVLSIRCPQFYEYLIKSAEIEELENNRVMYHIRIGRFDPVFGNRPGLLRSWLQFLYTGDVKISNVGKFLDIARKFSPEKIYPILCKLCSKRRRYLDICGEIVFQICEDFRNLYTIDEENEGELQRKQDFDIDEEEEFVSDFGDLPEIPSLGLFEDDDEEEEEEKKKEEEIFVAELPKEKKKDYSRYHHSDLRLVFADGTVKHVHRVFLCQSKYFKSMLLSNFKEARMSEIEFDQFNKEAILDILSYIYTGFLEMNPQNCVGVLIYSLQFELLEVSTACRRVVEEFLEHDTVIELLSLAELYCDQSLKAICKLYIVRNYEVIKVLPGFEEIESRTRQEMFLDYSKKKMREQKKRMKKDKQKLRNN